MAVTINGNRYYYGSIEIRLKGRLYAGVKSISYGDKKKRGHFYGTSPLMQGRTRGKYEPDPVEIEIARAEEDDFLAFLMQGQPDTVGIGDVEFTVTVAYAEPNSPVITDTLENCAIDALNASNQDGVDPSMKKLTLDTTRILWNGRPLAGNFSSLTGVST